MRLFESLKRVSQISRSLAAAIPAICLASPALADSVEMGRLAYQMNCMACHQVDVKIVGPSLVAVAETYPKEKQAEFIAWAKAPGKKDPKLLQMPPMAHVPEETLAAIHEFILVETKGKEEKRGNHQFPRFKEPERELPYVVRAFLPDTSPASVGVILNGNISLCWDTEACRFRYAWRGSRTHLRQGHTVVKLEEEPYYRETSEKLWPFAGDTKPEFHGYRLQSDGAPEFAYSVGDVEVRELVRNGKEPGSFTRSFSLSKEVDTLKLNLSSKPSAPVTSDKGEVKNGVLTLTGEDTKSFTLTISQP